MVFQLKTFHFKSWFFSFVPIVLLFTTTFKTPTFHIVISVLCLFWQNFGIALMCIQPWNDNASSDALVRILQTIPLSCCTHHTNSLPGNRKCLVTSVLAVENIFLKWWPILGIYRVLHMWVHCKLAQGAKYSECADKIRQPMVIILCQLTHILTKLLICGVFSCVFCLGTRHFQYFVRVVN